MHGSPKAQSRLHPILFCVLLNACGTGGVISEVQTCSGFMATGPSTGVGGLYQLTTFSDGSHIAECEVQTSTIASTSVSAYEADDGAANWAAHCFVTLDMDARHTFGTFHFRYEGHRAVVEYLDEGGSPLLGSSWPLPCVDGGYGVTQ